jgi:hypothetical protein
MTTLVIVTHCFSDLQRASKTSAISVIALIPDFPATTVAIICAQRQVELAEEVQNHSTGLLN